MSEYLSYLMGADKITDTELENLGIKIEGKTESGSRKLKIPQSSLSRYFDLVKDKMTEGFWNEILGEKEIVFIFKFKDGHVEEYTLSPETEPIIDKLCAEFNNEEPETTANVYKYISENDFYHDFMLEHYKDMINLPSPTNM